MNRSEEHLKESETEMQSTRGPLERVPPDRGEWKPHPKSFSLAYLAQPIDGPTADEKWF